MRMPSLGLFTAMTDQCLTLRIHVDVSRQAKELLAQSDAFFRITTIDHSTGGA